MKTWTVIRLIKEEYEVDADTKAEAIHISSEIGNPNKVVVTKVFAIEKNV